jgi:hypothetical protein
MQQGPPAYPTRVGFCCASVSLWSAGPFIVLLVVISSQGPNSAGHTKPTSQTQ